MEHQITAMMADTSGQPLSDELLKVLCRIAPRVNSHFIGAYLP